MDNNISQKTENIKRYLPHDLKTKENAVKTYIFKQKGWERENKSHSHF